MDSVQQDLNRGFNWLGGATILAKIIDFSTILGVLAFLTKQQVGVASVVVAVGMVVEALDGFGVGDAIVQAPSISRAQLDSLFWFVLGSAVVVAAGTLLAAPLIEAAYGVAGLALYFPAIAIKQPLVGLALIPLAMLNRGLMFERIAVINVCATLAAAASRLGLAYAGFGAWAIVAGATLSGGYVLIGAMIASPFVPKLSCRLSTIRPLLRFGARSATSNVIEQTFKNVDFLLVGWFYGVAQLAIYRIAFDIAMEPAMAIGTLINRTALPVFARVSASREQLATSFTWALRRLATLATPLMVGLAFIADPLTRLIHDRQGNTYAAAATPLKILAAAGLLRIVSQLLFPLMVGTGRPGAAARLSATVMLLLTAGIFVSGSVFTASTGIVAIAAVWLGLYPFILVWAGRYVRRALRIRAMQLIRLFAAPMVGGCVIVVAGTLLGNGRPVLQICLVVGAVAVVYGGLFLSGRGRQGLCP